MNNLPGRSDFGQRGQVAGALDSVPKRRPDRRDLRPNLSVTGSLATILWLTALRREGHNVSALSFLKVGMIVMTPALILALASALAFR